MISIIIPTYKRSEHLVEAVESVLNQSGNFELIVVDDNDSNTIYRENNERRMRKYKKWPNFHYLKHEKNKNGAAARNTGIACAKGDYITFLDDDDIFCANRVAELENIIAKEHPDFICTGVLVKKNGMLEKKIIPNVEFSSKELQIKLLNQKSFFVTGSNIICKKDLIDKIHGFDEKFIRHQDTEFVIRLLDYAKSIVCIPEYLVVKNCDDRLNIPSFFKMVEVKKRFLDKFSYILDQLSFEERQLILENNYYELLKNAYASKDSVNVAACKKFLKQQKIYTLNKDMKIYLKYKIKQLYIVKKIRSWIKK